MREQFLTVFFLGTHCKCSPAEDASNDYRHELINEISRQTNLSQIALFNRLLYEKKISYNNYNKIKNDFDKQFKIKVEEDKRLKELKKQKEIKQRGSVPQPIKSPL